MGTIPSEVSNALLVPSSPLFIIENTRTILILDGMSRLSIGISHLKLVVPPIRAMGNGVFSGKLLTFVV